MSTNQNTKGNHYAQGPNEYPTSLTPRVPDSRRSTTQTLFTGIFSFHLIWNPKSASNVKKKHLQLPDLSRSRGAFIKWGHLSSLFPAVHYIPGTYKRGQSACSRMTVSSKPARNGPYWHISWTGFNVLKNKWLQKVTSHKLAGGWINVCSNYPLVCIADIWLEKWMPTGQTSKQRYPYQTWHMCCCIIQETGMQMKVTFYEDIFVKCHSFFWDAVKRPTGRTMKCLPIAVIRTLHSFLCWFFVRRTGFLAHPKSGKLVGL